MLDRITTTRRSRHKRPKIHTRHTDQTAKLERAWSAHNADRRGKPTPFMRRSEQFAGNACRANGGFFAASSPGNAIDVCSRAGIPPPTSLVRNGAPGSNSSCEAAKSLQGSTGDRDRPDRCMTRGKRSANCIRDEGYVAHCSRQLAPHSPSRRNARGGAQGARPRPRDAQMAQCKRRVVQIAYNSELICSFVALNISVSLRKQHEKVQMVAPPAELAWSADNQLVTFCCQDDY
jgi:hypothetical protein